MRFTLCCRSRPPCGTIYFWLQGLTLEGNHILKQPENRGSPAAIQIKALRGALGYKLEIQLKSPNAGLRCQRPRDWSWTGSKYSWQSTRQKIGGSAWLPLTGWQWDGCSEPAHQHKIEREEKRLFLLKEPKDGSFLHDLIATTEKDGTKGHNIQRQTPEHVASGQNYQATRLQKDRGHT